MAPGDRRKAQDDVGTCAALCADTNLMPWAGRRSDADTAAFFMAALAAGDADHVWAQRKWTGLIHDEATLFGHVSGARLAPYASRALGMPTIFLAVDADDLQRLTAILRQDGYRVVGVSDADTAGYILTTLRPDLIIAEFPGLEVGESSLTEHLCGPRKHRECRTLALVKDYARGLAAAAVAEGFDAVYARPIVASTLLPVVERLLQPAHQSSPPP